MSLRYLPCRRTLSFLSTIELRIIHSNPESSLILLRLHGAAGRRGRLAVRRERSGGEPSSRRRSTDEPRLGSRAADRDLVRDAGNSTFETISTSEHLQRVGQIQMGKDLSCTPFSRPPRARFRFRLGRRRWRIACGGLCRQPRVDFGLDKTDSRLGDRHRLRELAGLAEVAQMPAAVGDALYALELGNCQKPHCVASGYPRSPADA